MVQNWAAWYHGQKYAKESQALECAAVATTV